MLPFTLHFQRKPPMNKRACASIFALFLALSACSGKPASQSAAAKSALQWKVSGSIKAADGGYDYASINADARKLYIGRQYGVMTVDLNTQAIGTLIERDDVASVLLIPGTELMLTTNNGADTATLLNRQTGQVIADIKTGKGPDGALYIPDSGQALVMNGDSEDITVIDISTARTIDRIPAGGTPEAAVTDGKGRLFINIEDKNEILVVDAASRKAVTRYPLPGCTEPTGITYDGVTGLLIPVCHNRVAKLIDAATGADRGTIRIGAGADGSLFDPHRRIGYVPCIDGTLTIYHLDENGQAVVLQTLETADGARTAAFDPVTERLYLPAATVERDDKGDYLRAEKNFSVVVVGQD
jgi:YVTN family beta-propeller protein